MTALPMEKVNNRNNFMKNPITLAHHIAAQVLRPGDTAVDATAGNGYDTLFLCRAVGSEGVVFAFDNQPLAIGRTAERIKENRIETRVYLVNAGHENMADYVKPPVQVVMFNLGFMPGTGHLFATRPETTVAALEQAGRLLDVKGLITVVVYTGHPGAAEEQAAVDEWAAALPQKEWTVLRITFNNWRNKPPYILVLNKIG